MKILITGAGGFVGQYLARKLLDDASNHLVVLTDVTACSPPSNALNPHNATSVKADLSTADLAALIPNDINAVVILHGIMSAGAEANLDLGMRVNFDATRHLLNHLRHLNSRIRVIYASSIAVYGRPFPHRITEDVFPTPEGSYGVEKLMCEALINDYTRRGFIEGFSVRLPGITVRPGPPSQAASSFLSGIFREPLAGRRCLVPTRDRGMKFWICSPKVLVENLVRLLRLPVDVLPRHKRALNLPGMLVSIQEMRDALAKVAGEDKLQYIDEAEGTEFEELVKSWPSDFDVSLALRLGLAPAERVENAAEDYIADIGDGLIVKPHL
ncbi:hypothetical protein H2200_001008 [Cladophialophora chaetospira]|uniref:NAD-dependent epimerase/dehydratase domain-containing protein n=1 Tax=Cladophialophora chaetospira TaxID=386627 RepID=A0AA38XPN1_9EURO|nr:hypothetical protein H2200_001008 [Cladophialophora chaetospira]